MMLDGGGGIECLITKARSLNKFVYTDTRFWVRFSY